MWPSLRLRPRGLFITQPFVPGRGPLFFGQRRNIFCGTAFWREPGPGPTEFRAKSWPNAPASDHRFNNEWAITVRYIDFDAHLRLIAPCWAAGLTRTTAAREVSNQAGARGGVLSLLIAG